MKLEDLKEIEFENEEVSENEEKAELDTSKLRQYSKSTAITIAYLLGVSEEYIGYLDTSAVSQYCELSNNRDALVVRALNSIRSNIMLNFKKVSQKIRVCNIDYEPIYRLDLFKDDFKTLEKAEVNIVTGKTDLVEYLEIINVEICRHIEPLERLFPKWLDFKHIKRMFNMPMSKVKKEIEKYQLNCMLYPYKRYFYWKCPCNYGNILLNDAKFLDIIYENDNDYFEDEYRVIDASEEIKNNINSFINSGNKIQIFVDGENCNPYKLASMFDSLKDYEIQKIDKVVVYYDSIYTSNAWRSLHLFTYGVDVEAVAVERISENKSLVDHKLVAGVSKAIYKDNVDSIILASSDSDFWSVIQNVDANYLVLVENGKCSNCLKKVLKENDVFYCYLDRFKAPEDDEFFEIVFKKELEKLINENFILPNANTLLNKAIFQSRAKISSTQKEKLFKNVIKKLKLTITDDGNFAVEMG